MIPLPDRRTKMKRKKSIRPYKTGKLMVVEDRSAIASAVSAGELNPEEAERIFAEKCRKGKLLNGEDGAEYKDTFVMPKFFLGASNAGTIMGHDHFKSRLMLQHELLGLVDTTVSPSMEYIFAYGHEAEPFVAGMGARQLRAKGIDLRFTASINGYIHGRWPAVLIHPDGFMLGSEYELSLAEVKTASEAAPYWVNDFSRDEVPLAYQDQCQVMMEILDLDECWVLAYNKTGSRDAFRQIKLERDSEYACEVLDKMMEFYKDTVNGILYEEEDIISGEENILFSETDKTLGYIDLPKRSAKIMESIDSLEAERATLKQQLSESEALIREIEKQLKLEKARLIRDIKSAPGGTIRGEKEYRIEKKVSFSKDQEAMEMLANEYPEAYDALKSFKPKVSIRITRPNGSGEAEQTEIE